MNFVSCADLARDVLQLVPFCVRNRVSAIYGVPRSGMLPATLLATALHLPCGVAGEKAHEGRRVKANPVHADGPVLLIDDSVNNGGSMKKAVEEFGPAKVLRACVYIRPKMEGAVDAYAVKLDAPRLFEWNLFNSERTPSLMFDLDGVFCFDPTTPDDDGPLYQHVIANALPMRRSVWPVGWIATNRIERWREITEAWLGRNGIQVRHNLFMQPYASAVERRAKSTPAGFKAACYMSAPSCELFVESCEEQAVEIHRVTKRPVLSLETMKCLK